MQVWDAVELVGSIILQIQIMVVQVKVMLCKSRMQWSRSEPEYCSAIQERAMEDKVMTNCYASELV